MVRRYIINCLVKKTENRKASCDTTVRFVLLNCPIFAYRSSKQYRLETIIIRQQKRHAYLLLLLLQQ